MKYTKWAVRRTKNTYKEINEYFSKLNKRCYSGNGTYTDEVGRYYDHDFLIFPHINKSTFQTRELPDGYKEISFTEFLIHIGKKQFYEIY